MNNKELIQKAMVTTDAIAAAGKLNPEQANTFIDYVFDVTGLSGKVRQVKMKADQYDVDKISVGKRVAMPKEEARDPGKRRGIQTSKVSLNPKSIMVPFEISDEFMDYNIEGADVEDHVIKMMATQFANDIEELYIGGDVLGPAVVEADIDDSGDPNKIVKDTYLALFNGWLKIARAGHVVDFNGANINSTVFSKMINALPEKFKRMKQNMKFFGPSDIEQNYRQGIGSRATVAGDQALSTSSAMTPFGIEYVPIPLINSTPNVTEHVTLNGVVASSLLYKNLVTDSEIVVPSSLGVTPITPYVEGVDYTMNYATGTIVRLGGGSIPDGATVKITYKSESQIILTEFRNLIVGIGMDIKIEKAREIFKGVNQYAITARVGANIENLDALVQGVNIGLN